MITILMPLYNGVEFLSKSVGSIQQQTYPHWELLIGINGHPPNSPVHQQARKYQTEGAQQSGSIEIVDLPKAKGKSQALNQMVKLAKSDWIALLDVDDLWLPSKLSQQIPWTKQYDVIGTLCQYFGNRGDIPRIPKGDLSQYDFWVTNPVINSSCLIRTELASWSDDWDGVEDYHLWLQLWQQHKRFFNVPEILVKHRLHPTSSFNAQGNHHLSQKLVAETKSLSKNKK